MIGGVYLKLFLGVGAFSAGLGLGWQTGHARATGQAENKIESIRKASVRVINETLAERDQCHDQVSNFNQSMAALKIEIAEELAASETRRSDAVAASARAARQAADQAASATVAAQTLKERIEHVADKCAGSGVDPESLRLLNDIARAAEPELRGGELPASSDPD